MVTVEGETRAEEPTKMIADREPDPQSSPGAGAGTKSNRQHSTDYTQRRQLKTLCKLDKSLFSQIRAVEENEAWMGKSLTELQFHTTTRELSEMAKGLSYFRYSGAKRKVSVSGGKASLIGRILAWQKARSREKNERITESLDSL